MRLRIPYAKPIHQFVQKRYVGQVAAKLAIELRHLQTHFIDAHSKPLTQRSQFRPLPAIIEGAFGDWHPTDHRDAHAQPLGSAPAGNVDDMQRDAAAQAQNPW